MAVVMRSASSFAVVLCLCLARSSAFMFRCGPGMKLAMQESNGPVDARTTIPTTTAPTSKLLDRRAFVHGAAVTLPLIVAGSTAAYADKGNASGRSPASEWQEPEITQRAFMDISVSDKPIGRIVIALYGSVVPETVKNFISLLKGDNPAGSTYKGTEAYRVLDGLNIQMGAIGSRSGKSGKSATGESFGPENFDILHMKEGLLSMVRNEDAKNDSRFFISIQDDAGWADNRYVAFGRIVEGMLVVHEIERVKVEGGSNHPKSPVVISDCGLL